MQPSALSSVIDRQALFSSRLSSRHKNIAAFISASPSNMYFKPRSFIPCVVKQDYLHASSPSTLQDWGDRLCSLFELRVSRLWRTLEEVHNPHRTASRTEYSMEHADMDRDTFLKIVLSSRFLALQGPFGLPILDCLRKISSQNSSSPHFGFLAL